ncbi:MAG: hypothetical protein WA364_30890 [Candidatus Nitrosopolaris sp.]
MALVLDSKQKEKCLRLKMPVSLLYSLRVIGRGSVTRLILEILQGQTPQTSGSKMVGRTTIEILDKLYYMWYPYPLKRWNGEIIKSKIGRFSLICPAHIYKLVQDSALVHLMPLKEFMVKILTNNVGKILEEDPFLFVKFQEAFDAMICGYWSQNQH